MRKSLSDFVVKHLELPPKGTYICWDEDTPGFGVRVSQGGARTFVFLSPRSKSRVTETIGRYPSVGLKMARSRAKELLLERSTGLLQSSSITWDAAVQEFLSEARIRPKTLVGYRYDLSVFQFARLRDAGPAELLRQLKKLSDRPAAYHHAYCTLRAFFNWAYRRHYVNENPLERMKAPAASTPRERILSEEELKKVWDACEGTFGDIVRVLILTGQRRGEIVKLSADMIEDDRVIIPAWLAKNKRAHSFPLGNNASSILRPRLEAALEQGRSLLFPAPGKMQNSFSAFSKEKARLNARSGVSDYTLHDLRRTFASGLASLGTPVHVIERMLNHVSGSFRGVAGVYNRYDYFPEMQEAIRKWDGRF